MASKQEIPLTTIIRDDFLTCKICFNTYDNPKILPCVHTYCTPCIEKLLRTSEKPGSISCPECRECVNLPHGAVSDLKSNFLINSLVDVLKVKTNKDVACTACSLRGKSSSATCRCLDCGDYLCSICSDGHNASSITWKHKKVLLEDFKEGSYDKELRNIHKLTCSHHTDKEIEYFCEACQIPICLACVLLSHRDHKCITSKEAAAAQKRRLLSHIRNVKEILQQLECKKTKVCEYLSEIKRRESQSMANIEEQIKGIVLRIEELKQNALLLVHRDNEETVHEIKSEVENMQKKITLVKGCLEFCEKMLEQGKDEEVLYLEDTITKRLQQLVDMPSAGITLTAKEKYQDFDFQSFLKNQVDHLLSESRPSTRIDSTPANVNIQQKVFFELMRSFDSHYQSDKLPPLVKGMAIKNNIIFISDNANGKIKCISKHGVLKECFTTDEHFSPFAVAVCKNVVGAIHENYLYMFTKTGENTHKLMLTDKLNNGEHFTFALASYLNDGFIVGNLPDKSLRMYAIDGTRIRHYDASFAYPLANLSVDLSGHLVTCEWGDDSVCVRTLRGTMKTRCQFTFSWKANAAQRDKNGFIYAVNKVGDNVSVFDMNGKHKLTHATRPDGLRDPINLAFDVEGLMYLVDSFGNISVYKIHVHKEV